MVKQLVEAGARPKISNRRHDDAAKAGGEIAALLRLCSVCSLKTGGGHIPALQKKTKSARQRWRVEFCFLAPPHRWRLYELFVY